MSDAIIEELWRTKDVIAREQGYDVERLAAELRKRGRERGGRAVDLRAGREAGERGPSDEPRSLEGDPPAQPSSSRRSRSGASSRGA